MRPVRLEMNGFASFRAETTVDFNGADYFALVGPTGAGKSTVIDAMVFALYGSAPRWGRATAIQYALAPTATSATVRLVFDVGAQRYQVAREVRRVGQSIQQRSAVLERFDDPAKSSATSDEVDVVASEVRDVTPAVEELLGLSFDDFTKAVVLPQGRFAEFLNATVGERQDILLKLLGAHQYDIVMRAAGSRRAAANADVITAEARIGDLGGATQEAVDEARARVEDLRLLGDKTAALQVSLDGAMTTARQAADALASAAAAVTRLAAVRIPDGLTDLASRSTQVRAEAERLVAEAAAAETAYGEARAALETGGNRSQLERLRDQWAELATLTATLADLQTQTAEAQSRTTEAATARVAAEEAWSQAFAAEAEAGRVSAAAASAVQDAEDRRARIAAVEAPEGLADLTQRLDASSDAVRAAGDAFDAAESADDDARQALRTAGDPVDLSRTIARCDAAIAASARVDDLTARTGAAGIGLSDAHVMAQSAEADLTAARARSDEARVLVTAAGLRAGLEVGHDCPVCAVPVATLPDPIDAGEADAAAGVLRQADLAARTAREAVTRAESEVAALSRTLAEARAQLADLAPSGTDPAEARADAVAGLAAVDAARARLEAAQADRSSARASLEDAKRRAAALDEERKAALTALREARSALLPLGAPVAESESVQDSWRELTSWASNALADLDATTLPRVRADHEEARRLHSEAATALAAAKDARERATADADDARSTLLRAESALTRATERGEDLRRLLDGAPPAAQVSADLDELAALERQERSALAAFQSAGQARNAAAQAERDLRAELASADRLLRETRDPLVPLGAPSVDTSDLPAAWSALADWAKTATTAAQDKVLAAHAASDEATKGVAEAEHAVVYAATDGGLEVSTAAGVASALAAESARAVDRVTNLERDLARLATLHETRAEAEERRQVAALLAEHLSAKKFQRWLAGAALDVLVEAASSSLLELSGGQFTLAHEKGEFFVIDHADAEAKRSVRTLSGGETFQASLALALALSAELSSMSSNAAKLDSIFLDEGFGSLDPDSLEVVAVTLERLAAGDRMVGIVTHVQGLAERIPTRFVVTRTSRSSTVVREG